jgi:predicted permease
VGDVRHALLLLLGAVGLVLLIACANIANLLLARASERVDEMAVRAALGAGRARLVEQLMSEAALLALGGGLIGLLLARLGLDAVLALPGLDLPRTEAVTLDGSVLGFTLAVVTASLVLFGLAPALALARRSLLVRGQGGTRRAPAPAALVAAQVALSVVLFLGTALLVRTILEVRSTDLGFGVERVHVLGLGVPPGEVVDADEAIRLHEEFRRTLEGLPGVVSVGAAFGAPLSAINVFSSVEIEGWAGSEPPPAAGVRTITPGYLATLGIALRAGRAPVPSDRIGAARVAWINETAARTWFGDADPLGRSLDLSASAGLPEAEDRTIVGVVADTRFDGPRRPAPLEVYIPHAQNGVRYLEYFVATREGAPPTASAARAALGTLAPGLPLQDLGALRRRVAGVEAETRLWAALLGVFTALALGLAALGLFGTVAYQVAVRRREIGLRMAIGAAAGAVVGLVLRQGLAPALVGLAAGLTLALGAVRLLDSLLFGVSPGDPTAWLGASAVLLVVIVLAALIPALRAVRIDPARTLRAE